MYMLMFLKLSQTRLQQQPQKPFKYTQCDILCQLWQCHSPEWSSNSSSGMLFVAQGFSLNYSK